MPQAGTKTKKTINENKPKYFTAITAKGEIIMKKNRLFPFFTLFICTMFFIGAVNFVCAAEFSADMIQSTPDHSVKGKVFVKGENFREEITSIGGGHPIIIFRKDKNLIWTLMPQNRMYMEMPATQKGRILTQTDQNDIKDIAEKKYLGTEKINGFICDKYRLVFKDKARGTTTQWISKKLKFPIKAVSDTTNGKVVVEYKNIRETKLSDSLFNIPAGYKKMTMPCMPGMKGMKRCPFKRMNK